MCLKRDCLNIFQFTALSTTFIYLYICYLLICLPWRYLDSVYLILPVSYPTLTGMLCLLAHLALWFWVCFFSDKLSPAYLRLCICIYLVICIYFYLRKRDTYLSLEVISFLIMSFPISVKERVVYSYCNKCNILSHLFFMLLILYLFSFFFFNSNI